MFLNVLICFYAMNTFYGFLDIIDATTRKVSTSPIRDDILERLGFLRNEQFLAQTGPPEVSSITKDTNTRKNQLLNGSGSPVTRQPSFHVVNTIIDLTQTSNEPEILRIKPRFVETGSFLSIISHIYIIYPYYN